MSRHKEWNVIRKIQREQKPKSSIAGPCGIVLGSGALRAEGLVRLRPRLLPFRPGSRGGWFRVLVEC